MIKKISNQNLNDVNGGLIVLGANGGPPNKLKYYVFNDRFKEAINSQDELLKYKRYAYGEYDWGDKDGLNDARNKAQKCGVSDEIIDIPFGYDEMGRRRAALERINYGWTYED